MATVTSSWSCFFLRSRFQSPSTFTFTFPAKSSSRLALNSSSSSNNNYSSSSQDLALLLEVDGVLMDSHRLGNRLAFNKAFEKLGLDCANWTEPVYSDLSKRSTGDEEKMVFLYFNRIGWPSSLPTNEKELFAKRVLQQKVSSLHLILLSGKGIRRVCDVEKSTFTAWS